MLGVFFDSKPDSINKSLGLTQAFIKEDLEFPPNDRDVCLVLYLMLVLLPAE